MFKNLPSAGILSTYLLYLYYFSLQPSRACPHDVLKLSRSCSQVVLTPFEPLIFLSVKVCMSISRHYKIIQIDNFWNNFPQFLN